MSDSELDDLAERMRIGSTPKRVTREKEGVTFLSEDFDRTQKKTRASDDQMFLRTSDRYENRGVETLTENKKRSTIDENFVRTSDRYENRSVEALTVFGEERMNFEYPKTSSDTSGEEPPLKNDPDSGASSDILSAKLPKYHIILFEESDVICGAVMSQGVAFCVKEKCAIKHRSKSIIKAKPGNLYILKNNETAFLTPTISTANTHGEVVDKWFE